MPDTPIEPAAPAQAEAPAVTTPAPAAEKLLAGKYKSVEDLERGYLEAQKVLSSKAKPEGKPAADPALKVEAPAPAQPDDDADVDAVLGRAGLKGEELAAAWTEDGKLMPEQYAALHAAGFPRKLVDQYMAGEVAKAAVLERAQESIKNSAVQLAGSWERVQSLLAEAPTFLTPKEVTSFNDRLKDPDLAKGAFKELMAMHAEAVGAGKSKPLVGGQNAPASNTGGFNSHGEMQTAMREADKKFGSWQKDPAFMKRLKNTPRSITSAI